MPQIDFQRNDGTRRVIRWDECPESRQVGMETHMELPLHELLLGNIQLGEVYPQPQEEDDKLVMVIQSYLEAKPGEGRMGLILEGDANV